MTNGSGMLRVTFYTRPGCHLCDDALDLLLDLDDELDARLCIEQVNILQDPELYARYRYRIPVIRVEPGGPTLYAPINEVDLRRELISGMA